jgi:hypothetical protein
MDVNSSGDFLEDDSELKKTKANTWTLAILRRLRNSLTKFLITWESFDTNQSSYFELDAVGTLYDNFRECYSNIKKNIAELRAVQMVLEQRIESLEKMSTVVLTTISSYYYCDVR